MYKYLGTTGIESYDFFNFISIIALLVLNMSNVKHKTTFFSGASIKFIKKHFNEQGETKAYKYILVAVAEIFFISLVQYGFVSVFTQTFGKMVGTGRNYFAVLFFVPMLLMIYFYIIKIQPLKQMDIITPAYPLALIFVKIACFCCGCCNGIEWAGGLLNTDTGLYEVPVQLAEAALALVIFVFLMFYRKKAKEGTLFPIFMIFYSGARFFLEFLRSEDNIIGIFKTYHILCFIGVIAGIIEYIIAVKYCKRINSFYKNDKRKRIRL